MYFRLLLICFVLLQSVGYSQTRGELISSSKLLSLTTLDLNALFLLFGLEDFSLQVEYPLDVYKLTYYTPAAKGDTLTTASGLMVVPLDTCDFPMLSYHHGTYFYGDELSELGPEWYIGIPFGTGGYVVTMPDYLGYGETPISHPHPYLHAKTEASASIDLIRAGRIFADSIQLRINDQVFLTGYSQGGHTTLAVQKEIEENNSTEFNLVAVGAGGGPFDLSGIMIDDILEAKSSGSASYFLGFTLTSYQYVYENIWNNPSDVFVPPYDVSIPEFFDRENPQPSIVFPDTAISMLQPSFVQSVKTDSTNTANLALRENDLYDWTPVTPLRMYYCDADEIVPFENSLFALDQFIQNGALDVAAFRVDSALGHSACAVPSFLVIKNWFDSLQGVCIGTTINPNGPPLPLDELDSEPDKLQDPVSVGIDQGLSSGFSVYPNPASEVLICEVRSSSSTAQSIELRDLHGSLIKEYKIPPGTDKIVLDLPFLTQGIYMVIWKENTNRYSQIIQIE